MADRALPDLIARIRLDSSGVDEAVNNLTGTFGRANLAMAGVAAGIGLVVVGMKSMIDIAIANDAAQADLAQAYRGPKDSLAEFRAGIDDFIKVNQPFIKSQAAVIEGFAILTREGGDVTRTTRDMGLALDIAATKHIDLSEAVKLVAMAEGGRFKGLIDLGISSTHMVEVNGKLHKTTKDISTVMDELIAKERGGRDTTSELDQQTNNLRGHWETLAAKTGPGLVQILDAIVTKANDLYNALDKIGKDDKLWQQINNRVVNWAQQYVAVSNAIENIYRKLRGQPALNPNWSPTWASDNNVGNQNSVGPSGYDPNPYGSGRGMASGGMIPGLPGAPQVITAHGGEAIIRGDQLDQLVGYLAVIAKNTSLVVSFSTNAYGRS